MGLSTLKKQILANPEAKAEYEKLAPEYELMRAMIDARLKLNLTQQELANKIGIDRTNISKLENGKLNPSIATLQKIADGMGMKLKLEFVPKY